MPMRDALPKDLGVRPLDADAMAAYIRSLPQWPGVTDLPQTNRPYAPRGDARKGRSAARTFGLPQFAPTRPHL